MDTHSDMAAHLDASAEKRQGQTVGGGSRSDDVIGRTFTATARDRWAKTTTLSVFICRQSPREVPVLLQQLVTSHGGKNPPALRVVERFAVRHGVTS